MPLHAGGDLAGRLARRAAAHVETCDSCRRLAAEFAETREWARAAASPPDFGAEFYESLRSGVLEQIRRDARPAGPQRGAAFFDALRGRRLAYAASFALALVACALAFNYYSRRAADAPQSPLAKRPADIRPADVRQAATPESVFSSRRHETRPAPPRAVDKPRRSHRRPEARPRVELAGGSLRRTPAASRVAPGGAAGRALNAGASVEPPAPRQVAFAAAAAPAKPGEVARVEMQTADPNIRIIWLAPQDAPAPDPQR